jgi:hypothetical protein
MFLQSNWPSKRHATVQYVIPYPQKVYKPHEQISSKFLSSRLGKVYNRGRFSCRCSNTANKATRLRQDSSIRIYKLELDVLRLYTCTHYQLSMAQPLFSVTINILPSLFEKSLCYLVRGFNFGSIRGSYPQTWRLVRHHIR